jgi:hypothetical protein
VVNKIDIAAAAGWKRLGHEQRLQAQIVHYADDFVICTRGRAEQARPGCGT